MAVVFRCRMTMVAETWHDPNCNQAFFSIGLRKGLGLLVDLVAL